MERTITLSTRETPRTREDALRRVIHELDDRRDGILPMHLAGVSEHFAGEADLIGALQLRWHATLSGCIERELAAGAFDQAEAVMTAWAGARSIHPGVRAALDAAAAHPADERMTENLRRAAVKEHAMLAASAGIAGLANPDAARIGARLERQARGLHVESPARVLPAQHSRDDKAGQGRRDLMRRVRDLVA